MSDTSTTDPLGLDLWEERLGTVSHHVQQVFSQFKASRPIRVEPKRIVATGLGSSEAHARYLVGLCQRYTPVPARFLAVSDFASINGTHEEMLALFSQGLSRNTQWVLDAWHHFAEHVLFTAASVNGLMAAGKVKSAEWLKGLLTSKSQVVPFPLEDEYTILIRCIGPVCGFMAARLWAERIPGATLPSLTWEYLNALCLRLRPSTDWFLQHADSLSGGFVILAPTLVVESGQNIIAKFVEGLFWPAPNLLDYLSFAHGPFQQLASSPRPVVLLVDDSPQAQELAARAQKMCDAIRVTSIPLSLPGCPSLAPVLAEFLFNPIVLSLARKLRAPQRDWPGKGQDAPLYAYP